MLENRPDVLKRFRQFVRVGYDSPEATERMYGFGFLAYYALLGYEVGVRYVIRSKQSQGATKAQLLDGIAIASLVVGPLGMETVARALEGHEWAELSNPLKVPAEWDPSLEVLRSGLDYSTPTLTSQEFVSVVAWYRRWLGEVPPYVHFLGAHHPVVLKAYRNRFENCLRVLPKQALPNTLLHFNVLRGNASGVRENALMGKGFGMTKAQLMRTIAAGMEYGSVDNLGVVAEATGDIFEGWQ
jgi:hypothetical protein